MERTEGIDPCLFFVTLQQDVRKKEILSSFSLAALCNSELLTRKDNIPFLSP